MPADACGLALRAATEVTASDGRARCMLLSIASLAATYACDGTAIVAIGEAAGRVAVDDETPVTRLLGQHLRGLGAYYAGDFAGRLRCCAKRSSWPSRRTPTRRPSPPRCSSSPRRSAS